MKYLHDREHTNVHYQSYTAANSRPVRVSKGDTKGRDTYVILPCTSPEYVHGSMLELQTIMSLYTLALTEK